MVERKHQHLQNVAQALYFQSQVPVEFWGDCILTATYLINRTPSPIIQNKTPFTLLFDSPVDYKSLKSLEASVLLLLYHLTDQSLNQEPKRVFVGYPPGIKGYKLYDRLSKSFFISRDVVFHEHLFPFHSIS